MAWRFKASKYKNAAPIVPKPEAYVRDICVGSYQTYGNNITASSYFMAFNWDYAGSSVAVLPLNDSGRKSKLMPLLNAHSDTVTDMHFSPFHDNLLATASQDCLVKIWTIPEGGLKESLSNPECQFSHKQRRVETVGFHPTSDYLLHSTSYSTFSLWDLISQKEVHSTSDHTDVIQSVSWKRDGRLVATSCKDKQIRILDPREEKSCIAVASSHQNIKDSRVVWLGDQEKILTTGFNAAHLRQIILRDTRYFDNPLKSLELDCSTGILMPLFDPDTNMLFLAGKGDATISYMEVTDKEPYLLEGLRHSGEQTKGACLVPKHALNVMQCEVNRILQLTSNAVIPITYQVPRKSYREFHDDLYPETPGYRTELMPEMWMQGQDIPVPKISLNPDKRQEDKSNFVSRESFIMFKEEVTKRAKTIKNDAKSTAPIKEIPSYQGVKQLADKFFSKNEVNGVQSEQQHLKREVKPLPRTEEQKHPETDDNHIISKIPKLEIQNDDKKALNEICVSRVNGDTHTVLPKPKPRTSRTNSSCEDQMVPSKPVARPRTNSCTPASNSVTSSATGTYKPLLGPKPFTPFNMRETESFDKVFSVPAVPGRKQHNGLHHGHGETIEIKAENLEEKETNKVTIQAEGPKKSPEPKHKEVAQETESEKNKLVEEVTNILMSRSLSSAMDEECAGEFERASSQRSSIAERRRMYENRSVSVQEAVEKPPLSPIHKIGNKSADSKGAKKQETANVSGTTPPKRTLTVFGRVSKFRHLKGTTLHKSQHIENVRNLSRQIPGESDGFHANSDRVAVPLSGPGGKIAVFELTRTGRLPDGVIPALVHGQNIMDFCWDPFDNCRLAVACDEGTVKLWKIPEDGLKEQVNVPEVEFSGHNDKIYFVKFHPLAKDVLATGSYDMTVKVWDLTTLESKIVLRGHTEQMFTFAWSPCGRYCSTFSKDGMVRVYEPRSNDYPIHEGRGPVGTRGGRLAWALGGRFIIVTGFDKVSERQVMVFRINDLDTPLNTISLDVSPSILIPFYDEDSSTLFVTGKGDSTVYTFEIAEEPPYICPLSHHRCGSLHQGLSFLPKNCCDVTKVEFAKAFRLTNNTVEPLSFTVPRIKTDLFQDDLFPPTRVIWKPTLTAAEWFKGKDASPQYISLKPEGMDQLSDAAVQDIPSESKGLNKTAASQDLLQVNENWSVDKSEVKQRQAKIQQAVSDRLEMNLKLEQDEMEGVDEKEWEEEE